MMTSTPNQQEQIKILAKRLWNYMKLNHKLRRANAIVGLGSSDIKVARYSAQLFLKGLAPVLVFSGGKGQFTQSWELSEAEKFANIASEMGVPRSKILIENKSSNTGENVQLTYKLLKRKQLPTDTLILVTKPYMERRVYATFKKQWPEQSTKIIIASPDLTFEDYLKRDFTLDHIINMLVGDLQRILVYPKLGFQIKQRVPPDVLKAYNKLIELGFTKRLLRTR